MSPTITATGTAIAPVGSRQNGQLSPVGQLFFAPTATSLGTPFFTARTDSGGVPFTWELDFAKLLEPGFEMLITAQPSAGGASASVNLEYSEL
jgi:hypothetical protein